MSTALNVIATTVNDPLIAYPALALVGMGFGMWQTWRNGQSKTLREVIAEKDVMIATLREEHEQFLKYRKDTHDTLDNANLRILKLTEENAELRTKSDLSPITEGQHTLMEMQLQGMQILQAICTQLGISHKNSSDVPHGRT